MTKSFEPPFVRSDAGTLAAAVVCVPSPSVERLVPRISEPSPIAGRALEQHGVLMRTLRDYGVDLTVLEPTTGSPGEALVADCAIMLPGGAVLSRPATVERRADVLAVERALAARGIPIIGRIAAPGLLDATDVALAGDRAFVGVPRAGGLGARSNAFGRSQLAEFAGAAGLRVVELALATDVPRLRTVFNVVAADTVVAATELVDMVPASGLQIVELPRGEEYAAGLLALGERRVLANLRFRESIGLLRAAKIDVVAIDLWEFGKAGVAPAQLVLATKRG